MEKKTFVSKALHILPKIFTYLPMFFILLWYCIRYRTSPAILIRVNPAFPYGGLISSKTKIFERFQKNRKEYEKFFLKTVGIFIKDPVSQRIEKAKRFFQENALSYPVIFKPDQAIAGVGLKFIQDEQELLESIHHMKRDYVLQEYLDRPYEL